MSHSIPEERTVGHNGAPWHFRLRGSATKLGAHHTTASCLYAAASALR